MTCMQIMIVNTREFNGDRIGDGVYHEDKKHQGGLASYFFFPNSSAFLASLSL